MNTLRHRLCAVALAASIPAFAATDEAPAKSPATESQPVRVQSVEVIPSPGGPVVVLNLRARSIPVFVDPVVALSIQAALAGQGPPRPLTHELTQRILESLDAKATEVVITLKDGTYRAALTISAGGKLHVFDSRASDAIALAIRFKAPILVDPSVVESTGVEQTRPSPDPI